MKKAFMLVFGITSVTVSLHSQVIKKYIESESLGDNKTRYYIYYDVNGYSPGNINAKTIEKNICSGDEIAVRYCPYQIFDLGKITLPSEESLQEDNVNTFIVYPESKADTFSIQEGYGSLIFATITNRKYGLRISEKGKSDTNNVITKIGDSTKIPDARDLIKNPREAEECKTSLGGKYADWEFYEFENVKFNEGIFTIEIFDITDIKRSILLARIDQLHVGDIIKSPRLFHQNDLSQPEYFPLVKNNGSQYYEALITSDRIVPGMHSINIILDYDVSSWQHRQAPMSSTDVPLKDEPDKILVKKRMELPNRIRPRAGFAVFNKATETRLISNFVLILSPDKYFSSKTDLIKRINPTIGVQIGGTGQKDIIYLYGISIKLITESDLIIGLRFGREQNEPWVIKNNLYFGASLDPGLFNYLSDKR